MTPDMEAVARELIALGADATPERIAYSPAKRGFITTIFYRLMNNSAAAIAYTNCGEPDQQNADAAFIVHGWNNAPAIARAYLEAREALKDARQEFYDTWHSGMSREEFESHPIIKAIDAALHPQAGAEGDVK